MWAELFSACVECGTTERKHYGKGFCHRCYNRRAYRRNPTPQLTRSNAYYAAHASEVKAERLRRYYANRSQASLKHKAYREAIWYDSLRQTALERDKHTCQKCGKPGNVVHHIDGKGRPVPRSEKNNRLENLQTLCRVCHGRVHAVLNGRWSKRFQNCQRCGCTDRIHWAKGLCRRCYKACHK